ncbi:MAG: hypothetical protein ACXVUE_15895 [Solirubrobacteraceae bacterium]
MEHPTTVSIDPDGRGCWEVALTRDGGHIACKTLDDARRVAYRSAGQDRPCELIVRDAYHRVIERRVLDADRDCPAESTASG